MAPLLIGMVVENGVSVVELVVLLLSGNAEDPSGLWFGAMFAWWVVLSVAGIAYTAAKAEVED